MNCCCFSSTKWAVIESAMRAVSVLPRNFFSKSDRPSLFYKLNCSTISLLQTSERFATSIGSLQNSIIIELAFKLWTRSFVEVSSDCLPWSRPHMDIDDVRKYSGQVSLFEWLESSPTIFCLRFTRSSNLELLDQNFIFRGSGDDLQSIWLRVNLTSRLNLAITTNRTRIACSRWLPWSLSMQNAVKKLANNLESKFRLRRCHRLVEKRFSVDFFQIKTLLLAVDLLERRRFTATMRPYSWPTFVRHFLFI